MEIKIYDGFVRLDAHMASDLSVVNSARVSFGARQDEMDERGKGLINFLMKNHHGTPFESSVFRFHVKTPIFIAREWFRHRWSSFNELSFRYAKVESPDFFIPEEFRTQIGKPGAYTYETTTIGGKANLLKGAIEQHYADGLGLYEKMIEEGVAREQARIVLSMGIYTEFYWTTNARALMNFINLRNHKDAQEEIREYAKIIEDIFKEKMPITHESFVNNGRIAP